MRADRLLSIVLLLQRHRHMTATALGAALGVTERTIYRDIEALSMSGIPVYTRTGPDGGCFLDEYYRSSLNWFTGAELQTLLYTGSASPLSDLGMQDAMDNAVLKLLAMLPDRHQQQAEQMRQRLYLDPSGWYGITEDHPTLPLLKEAVWEDLLIDAMYESWEGEKYPRTLAPYSLVYKTDRWYLVAESRKAGKLRTYRVSRLSDVRLRKDTFERDPDFDIAAYWQDASEQFIKGMPTYPVTLRLHTNMHTLLYFNHVMMGRYEIVKKDDDWWMLKVDYTVFEEALGSVLGLGTEVEVIEPLKLRQAVVEQAQAVVAKYVPQDTP